jgi:site-specific DNA recombinase
MAHPNRCRIARILGQRRPAFSDWKPHGKPEASIERSSRSSREGSSNRPALNQPDARAEAAEALRMLIERIVLTPGPERGEIFATLHGELGTILEWTERQALGKTAKTTNPAALATGFV